MYTNVLMFLVFAHGISSFHIDALVVNLTLCQIIRDNTLESANDC